MFRMRIRQAAPSAAYACVLPLVPVTLSEDRYDHDDMRHLLASVGGVAWGITHGAHSPGQGHGWRCSLLGCRPQLTDQAAA